MGEPQVKGETADTILVAAKATESRALAALAQIQDLQGRTHWGAIEELFDLLDAGDPLVRSEAAQALAVTTRRLEQRSHSAVMIWHRDNTESLLHRVFEEMRQRLLDSPVSCREAVAETLGFLKHQTATEMLLATLGDPAALVRATVATALGRICDPLSVPQLSKTLQDESPWVRLAAADALGTIASQEGLPALLDALDDEHMLVRAGIASALGHIDHPKARAALVELTRSLDPELCWRAALGLGRVGDAAALAPLALLLDDEYVLFGRSIAQVAQRSIKAIERRERGLVGYVRRTLHSIRAFRRHSPTRSTRD